MFVAILTTAVTDSVFGVGEKIELVANIYARFRLQLSREPNTTQKFGGSDRMGEVGAMQDRLWPP